jgi:hypothetical protein
LVSNGRWVFPLFRRYIVTHCNGIPKDSNQSDSPVQDPSNPVNALLASPQGPTSPSEGHQRKQSTATAPTAAAFEIGKPITLNPSSSAYRQTPAASGGARNNTWAQAQQPSAGEGGMLSKVSDLIFGW